MVKYCPECGKQIDGNPMFCPHCGEKILKEVIIKEKEPIEKSYSPVIKQADTSWNSWDKKQEKEKIKTAYILIGIIVFFVILIIVFASGILTNNLVPGGGQNPRVTMQNCYTSTGRDSQGSYVTFEVTVKNIGDGWAVGTYAQIRVVDQSGNVQYTNDIISIGNQNLDGSWRPMEVGEQQIFSFKSYYTSGDSSLTASITLNWDNKAGSRFNQHFSKTVTI